MKKLFLVVGLVLFTQGCWAKKPACAIIKVANDVCTILEYQGEDGQIYRVRLTEAELEEIAASKAAKEGKPAPKK